MENILDKAGLTDEKIAQHLEKIVNDGVNSDTAEARDAVKALELALKLKDRFPSTKIESITKTLNIDVNATPDELLNKLDQIHKENEKLLGEMRKK